jgi:hypothetical protein
MSDIKCWVAPHSLTGNRKFYSGSVILSYPLEREGFLAVRPPSISTEIIAGRLHCSIGMTREEMKLIAHAYKAMIEKEAAG